MIKLTVCIWTFFSIVIIWKRHSPLADLGATVWTFYYRWLHTGVWSILKLWLYLLCCFAGVKAYLNCMNSSSWLPTLHLGYQPSSSDTAKDRYVRPQVRKRNIVSVNIQFSDKPNVARNVKVDLVGRELQATSEGSGVLVNVSLLEESSTLDLEETDAVPVACAEVIREGGSDEAATADGEQETGIYVHTLKQSWRN